MREWDYAYSSTWKAKLEAGRISAATVAKRRIFATYHTGRYIAVLLYAWIDF
jgi:hypothetical protein